MLSPSAEGSTKLLPSSKQHPCPICGRTKDGSCSLSDSLVFCHHGSTHHPPAGLKPGDTHQGGDGQTWAYTGETTDGRCSTFTLDKPRTHNHTQQRQAPIPPAPTRGATAFWTYSPTFIVCRFPGDSPGTKKVRPLTYDGTQWRWRKPPAPRPLLNLHDLLAHTTRPVLITEGEPACDAAARLLPTHVATTWSGGTSNIPATDYTPLAGRTCFLWPDADDVGRKAMAQLAGRLLALGCTVSIIEPPDGAPQGWDLANAADWSTQDVLDHIEGSAKPVEAPEQQQPGPGPTTEDSSAVQPPPRPIPSGRPFNLLGFDDDGYFYQAHSTGQVTRIARGSHTATNLVALAPLAYWETIYPGKSSPNWTAAASDLFAEQAQHGVYSPDHIRGRGAWWDSGRSVVHLGDRLLIDGSNTPTGRPPGSRFFYERLAAIEGPGTAQPLDDAAAMGILDIACRFLWANPSSGLLIAGWTTLAPICGALTWRPHAWLTAASGAGKSNVLEQFVAPLLGDASLWPLGQATEAFIRQTMRADAIPVIFDEADRDDESDRKRIQSILALARAASNSERGVIGKGSATGTAQRYQIRSMFLMSAITPALANGADRSRFAQLHLRSSKELPPAERAAHWAALERDLITQITTETGRRLQARTITLIPVIRQSIKAFTTAATERFDNPRLGEQYGTLLAGAWSLMSTEPATYDQALALIDQNDWAEFKQVTEEPDELRCLSILLQHQLRIDLDRGSATRTISELIEIAAGGVDTTMDVSQNIAVASLGRHGLRVEGDQLLVSSNAQPIARILKDTQWTSSWPALLQRIPGASRASTVVRFKGLGGPQRATSIPLNRL